ncbi:MAG: response regulator [Desulfuromonadales bacterium]|jgi:CheY-like chemotaxis protein|nr:response regulator [Desulfuromonadales bacterium]
MSIIAATRLPILVVDDEKNYRIILSRILAGAGYRVLTADRPQAALQLLREQPVALILSDMRMPEIDGLELCRRVSRDIGSVPFILFSAFIPAHDRQQIDATVDAWGSLSKPFDNQEVLSLVEAVLTASASGQKASRDRAGDQTTSKKLYRYSDEQEIS